LQGLDYLMIVNDRLVPVEVKSGKTGTLHSLHNFMDESRSDFGIQVGLSIIGFSIPSLSSFKVLSF
jgi:uncharacterized protein